MSDDILMSIGTAKGVISNSSPTNRDPGFPDTSLYRSRKFIMSHHSSMGIFRDSVPFGVIEAIMS